MTRSTPVAAALRRMLAAAMRSSSGDAIPEDVLRQATAALAVYDVAKEEAEQLFCEAGEIDPSPGTWLVVGGESEFHPVAIRADNGSDLGEVVATCSSLGGRKKANAQRIVDCVNACRGVPSFQLRELVLPHVGRTTRTPASATHVFPASVPSDRICATFVRQRWGSRKRDDAIAVNLAHERFDATAHVLAMPLEEIRDLTDCGVAAYEIGAAPIAHCGPFDVHIEDAIKELFGVRMISNITQDMLDSKRVAYGVIANEAAEPAAVAPERAAPTHDGHELFGREPVAVAELEQAA